MRLLLTLLLVALIGVTIGCTKDESYKTREADPALLNADPGDLAPSDPSLSGEAPADAAKPDEAKPDEAKPDEAKPDAAKPDEAAKKE